MSTASLEGPLLALTVVIWPDSPALQVLGCQIILITYVSLQIYNWPWKAPILNIVDLITCFVLAILVVVTGFYVPQVTGPLLDALQGFSAFLMVILFGVVGLMILLAVLALVYRQAMGSQKARLLALSHCQPGWWCGWLFERRHHRMEGPSKNREEHTFLDPSPSVGFVRSGDSHHDGWEDASPLDAGQRPPQCVARGPADVPRGWNCCNSQRKENETYSNIILSVRVARKWRFMSLL